jgi:hypothetical protein
VDDGGHAVVLKSGFEASDLSYRLAEELCGLLGGESVIGKSLQNAPLALLVIAQGNCSHTLQYADIFPEQLTLTYSLSSCVYALLF